MAGKGTSHYKRLGTTGAFTAVTLPFVLLGLAHAIPGQEAGLLNWISSPFGAMSLLIFLTSAIRYCKLSFDDVIMDYFGPGAFLHLNKFVAFLAWAVSVFSILKIWLGA